MKKELNKKELNKVSGGIKIKLSTKPICDKCKIVKRKDKITLFVK